MATIPEAARELLTTGRLAHIVTLNPDGTPHVSLAWAGFDGDDLVWATFFDQRKIANLRRDPRIVVSVEQGGYPGGADLYPYLVIRGTATVTEGGALELMDRLAEFYIGPGGRYPHREFPPGFVIRVAIDALYGQGPWHPS